MSKKPNSYFEFNTSENPFAYIRTEEELNIFIQILKEETTLSKRALQLIWITSYYVLKTCRPCDHKIENLIRLISSQINEMADNPQEAGSPLEIIIHDCNNESLNAKWDYYKCSVYGLNSNCCKRITEECIKALSELSLKSVVEKMHPSLDFPYQATLRKGRKKYEVWFKPSDVFNIQIYENENPIYISINIPTVFYNKDQKDYLNLFLSSSDYSLKFILETKTEELYSEIDQIVKQKKKTSNKTKQLNAEWKAASAQTTDNLFDDIDDTAGQDLQRELYNKYSTAIHEAGHTVAAYLLNVDYDGTSIKPTKTSAGRLGHPPLASKHNNSIISYAGGIAVKIYFDEKYLDIRGMRSDIKSATKKIKQQVIEDTLKDNSAQNYCYVDADELGLLNKESPYVINETINKSVKAYEETYQLISANIHLVEALANELLKKETMSSEEINELLNSINTKK